MSATTTPMYVTKNVGTPGMNANRWKTIYRGASREEAIAAADRISDFAEVYEYTPVEGEITDYSARIHVNAVLAKVYQY